MWVIVDYIGNYANIDFQNLIDTEGIFTVYRNKQRAEGAALEFQRYYDTYRHAKVVLLNEIFFVNQYKMDAFLDALDSIPRQRRSSFVEHVMSIDPTYVISNQ